MRLSLSVKIVSLCAAITLLGVAVAGYGIYQTSQVSERYQHVAQINLQNAEALGGMLANQKDAVVYLSLWESSQKNPEIKAKILEKLAAYEKTDRWYQDIPFVEGESEVYEPVAKAWTEFRRAIEQRLDGSGGTDLMRIHQELGDRLDRLVHFQGEQGKIWSASAKQTAITARTMMIIMSVALLILALSLGFGMSRSISRSVQAVVDRLAATAEQVSAAAEQLSSSSDGLSQSTTEQAASLEQTAASLEQISAMINKSTDNAKTTAASSVATRQKADDGSSAVAQMIESMDGITQSNEAIASEIARSNQQFAEIVSVIQQIGEKTKVINEIVFQTKLLSFNASVEAARAGEHGKGFAVVAEEVGSLARMSGAAAQEISTMLVDSVQKVETIVRETKQNVDVLLVDGKKRLSRGGETVKLCSGALEDIVTNVRQVDELAREISVASEEQAQGVREINKAMAQLDIVTQRNATASDEAASAAASLTEQATVLRTAVRDLALAIQGGEGGASAPIAKSVQPVPRQEAAVLPLSKAQTAIALKSIKTTSPAASAKKAAGSDVVPDRNHSGFSDV